MCTFSQPDSEVLGSGQRSAPARAQRRRAEVKNPHEFRDLAADFKNIKSSILLDQLFPG